METKESEHVPPQSHITVEQTGVVAFPPLALTVGQCEVTVVGDTSLVALLIATEGGLPPPPSIFVMEGDTIVHAMLAASIGPLTQQVTLGTYVDRVPRLVSRVPQVVVIVMHALYHEEAGTRLMVELGEHLGVELGGVPVAQHLLVAHL